MESIKNVAEYYDELYPISNEQKQFYSELAANYPDPVKFLRLGCGTGLFEHQLAKEGANVTGLERFEELVRSANLRRRTQLMSIHFFQLSALDMGHYLGKGFYNIISCLDNRITLIHDNTLMRKFFFDCKELLRENGTLVLSLYNYNKFNNSNQELPTKESMRTKLFTNIACQPDGQWFFNQSVETGNGKILQVFSKEKFYPLKPEEIIKFSKEAGFTEINFYSSFDKSPFTGSEDNILVVLK